MLRRIVNLFRPKHLPPVEPVELTDPATLKEADEDTARKRAVVQVLEERARVALRQSDRAGV